MEKRISIADLAHRVGRPVPMLLSAMRQLDLEKGKRLITEDTAVQIFNVLGIDATVVKSIFENI